MKKVDEAVVVFVLRSTLYAVLAVGFVYVILHVGSLNAAVPVEAGRWKHEAVRQWRAEWGLEAPTAALAAQVQQESTWRANARSPAGAEGLTQFMPATATWLAGAYSALGPADPMNPVWALRAQARYDRFLYDRTKGYDDCERGGFMLSAYNGGENWTKRGIAKCFGKCNPLYWFGNVELVQDGRPPAMWNENRAYPAKILMQYEPAYIDAGWGLGMCGGR